MFLSVGYAYIAISQWYQQRRRKEMYLRAISSSYRSCSLLLQRINVIKEASLRSFLASPLLQNLGEFTESTILEDKSVVMSNLMPKQIVELPKWVSYYSIESHHHHDQTGRGDINVLLEAIRPQNIQVFLSHELSVPVSKKVHILDYGKALAWKSGPPFGIIMKCSLNEFVELCMGFCDGSLTMDEDLEVHRMITVDAEGVPSGLVEDTSSTTGLKKLEQDIAQDVNNFLSPKRSYKGSNWSNESLASATSVGNVDYLEANERDTELSDTSDISHQMELLASDSGAGEGLCDDDTTDSPLKKAGDSNWQMKPPNVMVYCGKKDSQRKFDNVKAILEQCLNPECYVIYHLQHDMVHNVPWDDNTALLIVSGHHLSDDVDQAFFGYFRKGGKVLNFGSSLDSIFVEKVEQSNTSGITQVNHKSHRNINVVSGRYYYKESRESIDKRCSLKTIVTNNQDQPVIVLAEEKGENSDKGQIILSQVLLDKDPTDVAITPQMFDQLKSSNKDRFDILFNILTVLGMDCEKNKLPSLTPCFLLYRNETIKTNFINSIEQRLKNGILKSSSVSLQFVLDGQMEVAAPSPNLLPVLFKTDDHALHYISEEKYWSNLTSQVYGNTVLYVDVIPTTMPLFDGLQYSVPDDVGLVAIAGRQTSGKGRGGNAWLSPEGCAMFSLHVRLPENSQLGKRASFLQHITSLAVIHAVTSLSGYENIDLRLKWPNDIYYSNKIKLGGVIVKSTIIDHVLHAVIGCGFNVSNNNPTICINDLIHLYNSEHRTALPPCSTDQLIARTVSHIEQLIDQFQKNGRNSFCQMYYKKWLHSNCKVKLEGEGGIEVTIIGVDEYGYLDVVTEKGQRLTVQPDGNSFDMMRNLITFKIN